MSSQSRLNNFVHIIEADEDATAKLESVIKDEPEYLDHMTQKLRDERDSREQLAALKAALEAEGKTVVEEAGHYGATGKARPCQAEVEPREEVLAAACGGFRPGDERCMGCGSIFPSFSGRGRGVLRCG
jgi:hypothetical protein